MIDGNVDEIVDLTDDFNSILDEYFTQQINCGEGNTIEVVDLDAWTTTDLMAVRDMFTRALEIRVEENVAISTRQ